MPISILSVEKTTVNNTAMASALSKTGMSMQTTATWVGRTKDDGMSGGETPKSDWGQEGKAGFLEEFPPKKYYLDKDLKCKLEYFWEEISKTHLCLVLVEDRALAIRVSTRYISKKRIQQAQ